MTTSMNREQAIKVCAEYFGIVDFKAFLKEKEDTVALLSLRHMAHHLPEYGINGTPRDSAQWVFIDMYEKIDTGEYGAVYYF